jgi:hypothetical protein
LLSSYKFLFKQLGAPTTVDVPIHKSPRNPDHIGSEFRGQMYGDSATLLWYDEVRSYHIVPKIISKYP